MDKHEFKALLKKVKNSKPSAEHLKRLAKIIDQRNKEFEKIYEQQQPHYWVND